MDMFQWASFDTARTSAHFFFITAFMKMYYVVDFDFR